MDIADNPTLDALAWFIMEDEVHSGGEWESKNGYWLTGRRACFTHFSSWEEIEIRSRRHNEVIANTAPLTFEFEETFQKGGSAREALDASSDVIEEGQQA